MFPETLEGVEVRSPAERRLYEAFAKQLDDHFTVIHSVSWLGIRNPGEAPADGEADFVVLNPTLGVLVLEVKGGRVGFDESLGWYSLRHDGSRVDIKDPFAQARRNKHALLGKIDSLPNWHGPAPTVGHAVAFPDGTIDLPDLGPDAPRNIILLHEDLADLEGWLRSCLQYWRGDHFVAPGEDGVLALRTLLRRSWVLREPRLGEQIGPEATAIHNYTVEQFRVLDLLAGRPRAAIRGCAGSGKTVLAVEKARRLAAEGFRTLLTCYNRNLAEDLRGRVGDAPRLKVQGFHALCQEYAARCGRDQKPDWDSARPAFFDAIMPDALAEAVSVLGGQACFDAIVVDEGQDFAESWWIALQMLLADQARGVLFIFYDDNQLIYNRAMNLPVDDLPFPLSINCRNTRAIHAAFARLYRSDVQPTCQGPQGRPVQILGYGGGQESLRARLTGILTQLCMMEKVRARDIVVLSPGGMDRPPLAGMPNPGVFVLVSQPSRSEQDVYSTTIRLFKGLERPVAILIVPEEARVSDELLYVGLSRAVNHAVVLVDAAVEDGVRNLISAAENGGG